MSEVAGKLYCPRRTERYFWMAKGVFLYTNPEKNVNIDAEKDDRKDEWRPDGTCSYCGSLNPRDFLEYVRSGKELGTTDKSYKVYLHELDRGKFYFQHLYHPCKERAEFYDLFDSGKLHTDGFRMRTPSCIYFEHMSRNESIWSEELRKSFINFKEVYPNEPAP